MVHQLIWDLELGIPDSGASNGFKKEFDLRGFDDMKLTSCKRGTQGGSERDSPGNEHSFNRLFFQSRWFTTHGVQNRHFAEVWQRPPTSQTNAHFVFSLPRAPQHRISDWACSHYLHLSFILLCHVITAPSSPLTSLTHFVLSLAVSVGAFSFYYKKKGLRFPFSFKKPFPFLLKSYTCPSLAVILLSCEKLWASY